MSPPSFSSTAQEDAYPDLNVHIRSERVSPIRAEARRLRGSNQNWLLCARRTALAVRLGACRASIWHNLAFWQSRPSSTLGNGTAQLYRGPCGSASATRQTPLQEDAITSKVMSSGLISRSPVAAGSGCTRRRGGGLTWHGGVAGGHWRSGRLLVAPGSGDRVSTSRYPLVSALSLLWVPRSELGPALAPAQTDPYGGASAQVFGLPGPKISPPRRAGWRPTPYLGQGPETELRRSICLQQRGTRWLATQGTSSAGSRMRSW
jgi:hypothetical protein